MTQGNDVDWQRSLQQILQDEEPLLPPEGRRHDPSRRLPDLSDEAHGWSVDDMWRSAFYALLVYGRAAAERTADRSRSWPPLLPSAEASSSTPRRTSNRRPQRRSDAHRTGGRAHLSPVSQGSQFEIVMETPKLVPLTPPA